MAKKNKNAPLVYSCSGCSSAAQLANYLAIQLDRQGHAEMSCIAGVGGDVPSLVRLATSGRPTIAIDGCKLQCVVNSLARHNVQPSFQYDLTGYGVKKRFREDFDPAQAKIVLTQIVDDLQEAGGTPRVEPAQEAIAPPAP